MRLMFVSPLACDSNNDQSLLMLALDTVVLFALTARWHDVRDRIGHADEPWRGQEEADLRAAEEHRPLL